MNHYKMYYETFNQKYDTKYDTYTQITLLMSDLILNVRSIFRHNSLKERSFAYYYNQI